MDRVGELQAGLWHWPAPHPDWTPSELWPQEVSSYATDGGARLQLVDPLSVPDELADRNHSAEPVQPRPTFLTVSRRHRPPAVTGRRPERPGPGPPGLYPPPEVTKKARTR
jgi:hypothetical protein